MSNGKDFALLASALGNILQAVKQASTETELKNVRDILLKVKEDRAFLESKLKEWQRAYKALKEKTERLEAAISEQNELIFKVQNEISKKEEEIAFVKKENEELKRKFNKECNDK